MFKPSKAFDQLRKYLDREYKQYSTENRAIFMDEIKKRYRMLASQDQERIAENYDKASPKQKSPGLIADLGYDLDKIMAILKTSNEVKPIPKKSNKADQVLIDKVPARSSKTIPATTIRVRSESYYKLRDLCKQNGIDEKFVIDNLFKAYVEKHKDKHFHVFD